MGNEGERDGAVVDGRGLCEALEAAWASPEVQLELRRMAAHREILMRRREALGLRAESEEERAMRRVL